MHLKSRVCCACDGRAGQLERAAGQYVLGLRSSNESILQYSNGTSFHSSALVSVFSSPLFSHSSPSLFFSFFSLTLLLCTVLLLGWCGSMDFRRNGTAEQALAEEQGIPMTPVGL